MFGLDLESQVSSTLVYISLPSVLHSWKNSSSNASFEVLGVTRRTEYRI